MDARCDMMQQNKKEKSYLLILLVSLIICILSRVYLLISYIFVGFLPEQNFNAIIFIIISVATGNWFIYFTDA